MNVVLNKFQSNALYNLYKASCVALRLNRKGKRKIMKTGNKFRNAGSVVKLKSAEIQFTINILAVNIEALQRVLTNVGIEDLSKKETCELAHQTYSILYENLTKVGENNAEVS